MRVFVQNWGSYNAGAIVGDWLDPDDYADRDEFWAAVMAATRNADEVMCADWEDAPVDFGEAPDWDLVWAVKGCIDGGMDPDLIRAYAEHVGDHYLPREASDLEEKIGDAYRGAFDSVADYAEEMTRSCQEIPDWLDSYIDWEKMGRDMEYNGDISAVELGGMFYIFDNH
jgi:antirestriction protein